MTRLVGYRGVVIAAGALLGVLYADISRGQSLERTAEPPARPSVPAPAGAQPSAAPAPTPSLQRKSSPVKAGANAEYVILVRTILTALNHANFVGDYSVLHKLAAPAFQESTPVDRLLQGYRSFRDQQLDLSPVLVTEPVFTETPGKDRSGNLRLVGYFDAQKNVINFTLVVRPVDGRWRYVGLAVTVDPVQSE